MFSRYKDWMDEELSTWVPASGDSKAYTLLRYHLGWADQNGQTAQTPVSQGKALRPTLCLFACEALSQDFSPALPAAAALELIHNFSLIHDDIQDQDRERRHQATVWHLWGIPKALVAGNVMQCVGDMALLNTASKNVDAQTTVKVSHLLTSSYLQMIEGQCLDLAFETRTDISTEEYLYMIACKTGGLIRSGLEIGAMLGTQDQRAVGAFATFGNHLGRAFQIRDDYLGIWGDEETTGKSAGNDIRRRKKSFPAVYALGKASGSSKEELLRIFGQDELDEEDVQRVLAVLDEVGAQEHSQRLTEASAEMALKALAPVTLPRWAAEEAESLVDFLSRREF